MPSHPALEMLAEIARCSDFANGEFERDWNRIYDSFRRSPLAAKLKGRNVVVFVGISFEQARHAAALARHTDLVPVLVRVGGDAVAAHYARAFPHEITVGREWEMFAAILALDPLVVTITVPSAPLYYRALLPLLAAFHGFHVIPFAYEIPSAPTFLSDYFKFTRHILECGAGFYSWYVSEEDIAGAHWTAISTMFNRPPGPMGRDKSLVYVGTLSPGTPEGDLLRLCPAIVQQGYTLDLFDARNDADIPAVPTPGITHHLRVPEFELLDALGTYRFGLVTPLLHESPARPEFADTSRPLYGSNWDWAGRRGVPGKMVMYLEAGVIPIVNVETEYTARFIEHYDIGYVFSNEDYFDLDRALGRKSPEQLHANLLRLRETELHWKNHVGALADYFMQAPHRVSFPRHDPNEERASNAPRRTREPLIASPSGLALRQ